MRYIVIQFILNQDLITIENYQADATLLDYLRLEAELKGTKEGCASGDCGVCTVVIASLDETTKTLNYKSINSCICLLGSVHGKQVITVEGLKGKDHSLHPVQQAMVEKHASQCGFCTPGFVMSIFSMSKQKEKPTREKIIESIDGNLCRCTGYRPIVDAAEVALRDKRKDHFDTDSDQIISQLNEIKRSPESSFYRPETLQELATRIQQHPDARLLAGGTDLALEITQQLQAFDNVIYIGNVSELKKLEQTADELIIGAAVTYQECATLLSETYPALKTHLERLGSLQIRNVGTLGGNIANASPIGDMPPVLLALDSHVNLQKGDRTRLVSMEDFFTGYKQTVMETGEFIRDIRIPLPKANQQFNVYKISKRYADDISAVCGAFNVELEQHIIKSVRIAFGGMAATVARAHHCEKALSNQPLTRDSLDKAKQEILGDFNPLDDVRASRDYRLLMAQNLLERLFIELGAAL